jgi:hypothetical protein
MHVWRVLVAASLALFCADGSRTAAGPVRYRSQSRTISGGLQEVYTFIDDGEVDDEVVSGGVSRSAPDFADWDDSLEFQLEPEQVPDPAVGSGSVFVSQRSSLRDAGISAAGSFDAFTATVDGAYSAEALVDVTFELDEARDYDMSYAVTVDGSARRTTSTRLVALDDGETVFEVLSNIEFDVPTGEFRGTLAPGRYRFLFDHHAGSDVGTQGPYEFELALNPAATTPIPLPPAVWAAAGACVLPLLLHCRFNRHGEGGRLGCRAPSETFDAKPSTFTLATNRVRQADFWRQRSLRHARPGPHHRQVIFRLFTFGKYDLCVAQEIPLGGG